MLATLKKVCLDCATNSIGEYDPARVIGYLFVLLGGFEFLILFAWSTVKAGKFDGAQFVAGLSGVSALLIAAATGVLIKKSAEGIASKE